MGYGRACGVCAAKNNKGESSYEGRRKQDAVCCPEQQAQSEQTQPESEPAADAAQPGTENEPKAETTAPETPDKKKRLLWRKLLAVFAAALAVLVLLAVLYINGKLDLIHYDDGTVDSVGTVDAKEDQDWIPPA